MKTVRPISIEQIEEEVQQLAGSNRRRSGARFISITRSCSWRRSVVLVIRMGEFAQVIGVSSTSKGKVRVNLVVIDRRVHNLIQFRPNRHERCSPPRMAVFSSPIRSSDLHGPVDVVLSAPSLLATRPGRANPLKICEIKVKDLRSNGTHNVLVALRSARSLDTCRRQDERSDPKFGRWCQTQGALSIITESLWQ